MSVRGFREIVISGMLKVEVRALSPLTIGSGRVEQDPAAPDIPLLKDSNGRPYIPGSTLKGFVRSGIERVLLGTGIPSRKALVNDLMGTVEPQAYGSRLLFTDAPVIGDPNSDFVVGIREHVALNPSTMAVRHGPFKQEYVEPGAKFKGLISFRNVPPSLLSLMKPIADLAKLGVLRLGRSKSRGYGHVDLIFHDLALALIMPDGVNEESFHLQFPAMGRSVVLKISRQGESIALWDDLSDCEVRGRLKEQNSLMADVEVSWSDVTRCFDPLIGRLKG